MNTVNPIFLTLIESSELTKVIGSALVILAAFVTAVNFIAKTVSRIRENARLAEKERHDETQAKISNAVEAERQRWLDHREDEADRIKRLREIADEWKDIATQKDIRNQLLVAELKVVHEELKELRNKYDSLLSLYTDSQARLASLEKAVKGE